MDRQEWCSACRSLCASSSGGVSGGLIVLRLEARFVAEAMPPRVSSTNAPVKRNDDDDDDSDEAAVVVVTSIERAKRCLRWWWR
jgi:hypothetical protein